MRSFVLKTVADGLSRCAPSKTREVLIDAFNATLMIPEREDEDVQQQDGEEKPDPKAQAAHASLEAKTGLQIELLRSLLTKDEKEVQMLLPQAEPSARSLLWAEMISKAVAAKELDRALGLLRETSTAQFPYHEAATLILKLPLGKEPQRQEIFQMAMNADRENHSLSIGADDFASMITRLWKQLPPSVALQAVSQVLDEAQSNDAQVNPGAGSTKATFSKEYEYRFFELLPVLEELDSSEAEKILRDMPEARARLSAFPKGIESLNFAVTDSATASDVTHTGGSVAFGIDPMLQQASLDEAYELRITEIVRIAENNPKQALELASGLPDSAGSICPRAEAFLSIARVSKSNASAARDALERISDSMQKIEPTGRERTRDYFAEGTEIAVQIGDNDLAKKLLHEGLVEFEKLRNKDTDSDDPNLAFKAWWPSTAVALRLVSAALRISPQAALDAIADISDPEVRMLCQGILADRELGIRVESSVVMMRNMKAPWAEYR